jgi:hypothetical protein
MDAATRPIDNEDGQRAEVSVLPVPAWLARALPTLLTAGFEHMPLMGHDLCAVMWLGGRALCWLRTTAADEGLSHLELVRAEDSPTGHTDTRLRFGLLIDLADASHVRVEIRRREWAWDANEARETCRVFECACDTLDVSALLLRAHRSPAGAK